MSRRETHKANGLQGFIMKKIILLLLISAAATSAHAQSYVKLNGVYALVGVINPSIEMPFSNRFTFNMEGVYSPWKSVNNKPMHLGIFLNEARFHFKENYKGWYVGASAGMQGFYMSKDETKNCKGWGILLGGTTGYQWRIGRRMLIEAFVGYGWQHSWYVGTNRITGEDIPYNMSSEWLPYKLGVNIGYKFFDPERRKRR